MSPSSYDAAWPLLIAAVALKKGLEGVPISVNSDASNRPGLGYVPSAEDQKSVEIAGTEILLQEVAAFTLTGP